MHLTSLFTLLAAGPAATQALAISGSRHQQQVGVGFSLTVDYATAALYYPDGSTVDLIKVEGSPKYRDMMKEAGREALMLYPTTGEAPPAFLTTQASHNQALLSERLSRWFDLEGANQGMTNMIKSLKVAAEVFLEKPIDTVNIVTPFPVSPQLEASINYAYRANTLTYAHPPQPAPELAAKYEGLVTTCSAGSNEKTQYILGVDWNRAAFTLTLLEEKCGVVSWRRILHDERLGDTAMRQCQAQYGEKTCDEEFIGFIRRAIEPLEADVSQSIQTMLLVGELSMSTKIMYQVKELLKGQYDIVSAADPTRRFRQRLQSVNPVFAAARAAGWDAWMAMTEARNLESDSDGSVDVVEL